MQHTRVPASRQIFTDEQTCASNAQSRGIRRNDSCLAISKHCQCLLTVAIHPLGGDSTYSTLAKSMLALALVQRNRIASMNSIVRGDSDVSKVLTVVTSAAGAAPKTSARLLPRATFVYNSRDDFRATTLSTNDTHWAALLNKP